MIDIVDYETLSSLEQHIASTRTLSHDDAYSRWKAFHDRICKAVGRFCSVSDIPDKEPDVYFSGDWFHAETDGFALRTCKLLCATALLDLQSVAEAHHNEASVSLSGDWGTPLWGLEILITGSVILVAWRNEKAESCRSKLRTLGIRFELKNEEPN